MRPCGFRRAERGIALITALLMLLLLLSVSLGVTRLVANEQGEKGVDLDRNQTFYAAYGAMEQLNAAVGTLFQQTPAPTGAAITQYVFNSPDINGNAVPPSIPGMNFYDPYGLPASTVSYSGGSGYEISYTGAPGNPTAATGLITVGAYQGFQGLITQYTITVSVQSQNYSLTTDTAGTSGVTNRYGSEVRLRRTLQTVAIPVFQFGIFSQTDLDFFPGPNFNFGGVVATNGNLYLAAGSTLTLSSRTSAYGDVIRDRLANGYTGSAYQSAYPGNISITTSPGTGNYRNLAFTEGSINGGPSGATTPPTCPTAPLPGGTPAGTPNANWTTISVSDYNDNLRNGAFGCSRGTGQANLQLPLVQAGATAIDLIKQPFPGENTISQATEAIYCQRYAVYPATTLCPGQQGYAMLRIFIADTYQEIEQIPEASTTGFISMTPDTQTVSLLAAPKPGYATVLPPWASSAGGTIAAGTAPCPARPAGNVYTASGGKYCNYGDWFYGGATGATALGGLSRLGMGDGISLGSPAIPSGNCPDGTQVAATAAPPAPATCGPYIEMQYQDSSTGGWVDVTADILRLGYVGRNLSQGIGKPNDGTAGNTNVGATAAQIAAGAGAACYEPNPDAVLRIQRLVDTPSNYSTKPCGYPINTVYAKLSGGPAAGAISTTGADYTHMSLFDSREGVLRDCWVAGDCPATVTPTLAGVMNYVEIDVNNLARWFVGTIGAKGTPPGGTVGYLLYISDRRGNQVDPTNGSAEVGVGCGAGKCKLGNLGWEDFVNPLSATGVPNNAKDTGEDLHGANETTPGGAAVSLPLETYGGQPAYQPQQSSAATGGPVAPYILCFQLGVAGCPTTPATGSTSQLVPLANLANTSAYGAATGNNTLCNNIAGAPQYPTVGNTSTAAGPTGTNLLCQESVNEARLNPPLFFRRAVKLTDAQSFSFSVCATGATCGLTIASENPVYVEGNYNAPGGSFSGADTPSAILADAVTLLSVNWNDVNSFNSPYSDSGRTAVTSFYRMAILAGKGLAFPQPTTGSVAQDFGTDGGLHNFLRYIENWSCCTLNYSGSLVSFFFNEQLVGTYKEGASVVYDPPTRGYNFDSNFLTPALLPPRTPTFRDINTLGFTQLIMPNQQ